MSTARRLTAIAAIASGFAAAICSSRAAAQSTSASEWATEEPDAPGVAEADVDNDAAVASSPERTPIRREDSAAERTSFESLGRRSWTWAWLPIALVVVLWWLVNRIRHGKSPDQSLLPEGVIVPLGRRPVGGGYMLQLIRIGSRILVVTPTADGLKTLTEITDPQEVERLVSMCLQTQSGGGIAGLFGGRAMRMDSQSERSIADANKLPVRTAPTVQQSRTGHAATRAAREVSR